MYLNNVKKIPSIQSIQCLRLISTDKISTKTTVIPDSNILNDISNEIYKPKHHPGRVDNSVKTLPNKFVKAVLKVAEDYPIKDLIKNGIMLSRYLHARLPPMEPNDLQEKIQKIEEKVIKKHENVEIESPEDERRFKQMITDKTRKNISMDIYNWEPIKYDAFNCLVQLFGRAAPEYAVLTKIFSDISARDKKFIPRSLFDFGSGVGTVTWAANNFWKDNIFEYFNVDSSPDMNDLAQILLQGGKGNSCNSVKGTFYRQFLPSSNAKYDIVTSAYSLMELPSLPTRLDVLLKLWNKTECYLILVEQGTNAGFKLINEARDFLLHVDQSANIGHVFSPCPHDHVCPRFIANDGTPCNFMVRYWTMNITGKAQILRERYSYIVLKKGTRNDENLNWPRIVREPLVRSKHTICRICTANGTLDELIFTAKKQGKSTYHCARGSKWGDLLPVSLNSKTE